MRTLRTNILITFFIIGSVIKIYGQIPEIKNQRGFEYRLSDYLDTIGFVKSDFNLIDCDFRIWQNNYSTGQKRLIRLQLLKNGKWIGKSLEYYCYNSNSCNMRDIITTTINLTDTWLSTWETIVNDSLLDIDDQKIVNERLKKEINEVLFLSDGTGYIIEIATKKAKRAFRFDNAVYFNDFLLKHGVESKEYNRFVRLIILIEKEFGFEHNVKGVNER